MKLVKSLAVNLRLVIFLWGILAVSPAYAILPQWWQEAHNYDAAKDWNSYYTYTAAFFGPNALPVPELSDGRIPQKHNAELSSDFFWGFGDRTQSLSARFNYVFIPGKISISAWGVLAEHYKTSIAIRDLRASMVESAEETFLIGDFYLSTQMNLTRETRYVPDLLLEFVLKTASSKSPNSARFFDTPGYYFDITAGKSINFKNSFFNELRFVGMAGFLCYQLNNYRQNDAPLFGGKIKLSSEKCSFETGINGYKGWQNNGDAPLVIRSRVNLDLGSNEYFIEYQHALRDYPFRRLQAGIKINF
jgi:hypothetical protein